jgi:hypothetical protein
LQTRAEGATVANVGLATDVKYPTLNRGVNTRRARRDLLPMASMMNILPEAANPLISDVRQPGSSPIQASTV